MERLHLSGIRVRLFLLVCLILIPIAIMLGLNSYRERKHALESIRMNMARIINFAVIHEEEIFEETRRILSTLAVIPGVVSGGQECIEFLTSVLGKSPQYANFGIARSDGNVYCSAVPMNNPVNIWDRSYFQEALEQREFSVGEYQVGRITGKPGINFGYPVLDKNGNVVSVAYAAVNLGWVAKNEYEVGALVPPHSTYIKLDRKGTVLSSYPTSNIFGRGSVLERPLFEAISRKKAGSFEASGVDGVDRFYVFSTLHGALFRDYVYVVLGIPMKMLFNEANRQLAWRLAILAASLLLALAAMWAGGRKLIARPVEILTDASKRLAAGDLSARAGLPATLGELGYLGGTFDKMAEELEQKEVASQRMQQQISKSLRMLSALREIDLRILGGANAQETLGVACDAIIDLGFRLCWVGLVASDGSIRIAAVRGVEEGALDHLEIRWDDPQSGSGPSGTVIRTGKPYISRDILGDERFAPWKDKIIEWGLRSLVSFPLKSPEGKVFGVFHVYHERESGFPLEDVHDLETFAQQCNLILNSAQQLDELRNALQRLSFHVNRMPLGYIVWDREFRVMEWNPAAERIFGWRSDEASGKHAYGLIIPPEAQPHMDQVWSKMLKGNESSYSVNANVSKDGKTITCEWFNAPLRDGLGNVIGVLSMVHDVTEKTQMERQLQTAQRMESVGTLAGGIAHDFNNALTGILGYSEMLRRRLADDPKSLADLDEISRASERAATLTRQLLTFAHRQVVEPVNLDIGDVVKDLVKFFTKVAGAQIEVKTFLASDTPTAWVDRGQIEQVLMNLLLNARDAMPDRGQLLVETGPVDLGEEYIRSYPYMKAGRYALLAVSDTGTGMDDATRERVFEPFFTTKAPDKGTGLGLSVVYGIVKQHNGFIHVYSEPGKGSTFKVYLPAVEVPPDVRVPVKAEPIRGGSETILLAEDEESVRGLAERILKDLGYTVLSARNGEEAFELFRTHGEKIALAVLDVVMPRMGGKETIEAIRKENPGLKAIFMSGYSANAIHEVFIIQPGSPFLGKPFTSTALARKVREVLDG